MVYTEAKEKRKFDLSHSGLQFEWDFDSLIGEELSNVAKHHIIDKIDPREFIAQKEGISKDRVVVTHGATQALQVALLSVGHNLDQDKIIAVESPSYAPVSQTANLLGYSTIPVHRNPLRVDLVIGELTKMSGRMFWKKHLYLCSRLF